MLQKGTRATTPWSREPLLGPISRSLLRMILGLSLVVLPATFGGCKGKVDEERGLGLPDTHSARERVRMDPRCELNELVKDPAKGTLEWAIADLLGAASSAVDDEASFRRFFAHFDGVKEEAWVKRQYWPRAREHVAKYLGQEGGGSFRICRRVKQPKGAVKVFIKSFDPDKSNPPITLQKDEGGPWKVIFYTP